ncbi:protein FATTY ACID EXPORT 4, chloroplastic [Phoenix dactylifera]|uniref:Protein FATTY ACID EXPORT 4, chloroplastic n=1 Tax=Phoenix dactylifera TaxID=42345 RepID=A0A8B7CSP0_PHODC|nr:protein FATTY ACID EXPORT 4, chloroplastic [Phoenix dactylifera]
MVMSGVDRPAMSTSSAPYLSRSSLTLCLPYLSSAANQRTHLTASFSRPILQRKWKNDFRKKTVSLRCSALLLADVAPATCAAYGTLLLGGGVFAYARSGSRGSILGGLSGAALMAVAYYLMQSPETKAVGDAIGFGSAFLFAAVFGIRLAATRKFIPSGLLLGLSAGALAVFFSAYMQDKF